MRSQISMFRSCGLAGMATVVLLTGCSASTPGTVKPSSTVSGQWKAQVVGDIKALHSDPAPFTADVATAKKDLATMTKDYKRVQDIFALGDDAACNHAEAAGADTLQVFDDGTVVFNDTETIGEDASNVTGDDGQLSEDLKSLKDHHGGTPPRSMNSVRSVAVRAMNKALRQTNNMVDTANHNQTKATKLTNQLAADGCHFAHLAAPVPLIHVTIS